MKKKTLAILGSTGSVGRQSLDVVRQNKDALSVACLSANTNVDRLSEQILEFNPTLVAVGSKQAAQELKKRVPKETNIVTGLDGLCLAATHPEADMVVTAISGSVGILPTIAAIKAGKDIALANKETMVAAGEQINATAKEYGVSIIPVDSEHNAIFQCLYGNERKDIRKILLTASGGPFFGRTAPELKNVTVQDALKHPNWSMGSKISIDSATLMNKGLELIEAVALFGVDQADIQIVIHPQSLVHSMVEFIDGSIIAQLAPTDMRLAIHNALFYPQRVESNYASLDFFGRSLTFFEPDEETFQALRLARQASITGGTMPLAFSAANEVAVEAFLQEQIGFLTITTIVEEMMMRHNCIQQATIEEILYADAEIKRQTRTYIDKHF